MIGPAASGLQPAAKTSQGSPQVEGAAQPQGKGTGNPLSGDTAAGNSPAGNPLAGGTGSGADRFSRGGWH